MKKTLTLLLFIFISMVASAQFLPNRYNTIFNGLKLTRGNDTAYHYFTATGNYIIQKDTIDLHGALLVDGLPLSSSDTGKVNTTGTDTIYGKIIHKDTVQLKNGATITNYTSSKMVLNEDTVDIVGKLLNNGAEITGVDTSLIGYLATQNAWTKYNSFASSTSLGTNTDSVKTLGTFINRSTVSGIANFKLSYTPITNKIILSFQSFSGLNKLYVDTSDNWHFGATSATLGSLNYNYPYIFAKTNSATNTPMLVVLNNRASATNTGSFISVGTDDGAALGSAHVLGGYNFSSARDASHNINNGAVIYAVNNSGAAWATNDYPSDMIFGTTTDGTASPTDRFKIAMTGVLSQTSNIYMQDSLNTQKESSLKYTGQTISFATGKAGYGEFAVDSAGTIICWAKISWNNDGSTKIISSDVTNIIYTPTTTSTDRVSFYDAGTNSSIKWNGSIGVYIMPVVYYREQ